MHSLTPTPTEFELGTGLFVTVSEADLDPPLFSPPAYAVSGAAAPDWPTVPGANQVLQVWYVWPPSHTVLNPLPTRITDTWGVGGTHLWTLDDASSGWQDEGPLSSSGGYLTGPALNRFAAVAVVVP